MRKRRRPVLVPLPLMMAEIALASWETIARRTLMIAEGRCTPAEYQRMVLEKMRATHKSSVAMGRSRRRKGMTSALAPWHGAATANAKRLRKR
jgi:hypothetical protein